MNAKCTFSGHSQAVYYKCKTEWHVAVHILWECTVTSKPDAVFVFNLVIVLRLHIKLM